MEDQEPRGSAETVPVPNRQDNSWVPHPRLAELVPWADVFRISEKITDTTADGRVYKAQAKETRESCVLKVVYKAADKETLYRELDVLNNVKHPNVLLLLRACSVPKDNVEFVMAFPEADTDRRCMLARREGHRAGVSLVQNPRGANRAGFGCVAYETGSPS